LGVVEAMLESELWCPPLLESFCQIDMSFIFAYHYTVKVQCLNINFCVSTNLWLKLH